MTHEEEFQQVWAKRKFRCTQTGQEFTIPDDVQECDFFKISDVSFIDVGRLGFYSRYVGYVEEVV